MPGYVLFDKLTWGNMMQGRLRSLDMMRGIAVILMAFMHSLYWGGYGNIVTAYSLITDALAGLRMPVLLMISGISASKLIHINNNGPVARRCVALFWLYIIWLPINISRSGSYSLFFSELLIPATHLWFLWVLTLLTASIVIVKHIPRALAVLTIVLTSTISYYFEIRTLWLSSLLHWSCFFYIGLFYKVELVRFFLRPTTPWSWPIYIILIVALHIVNMVLEINIEWPIMAVAERFVICCAGLSCMKEFERFKIITSGVEYVGKRTFAIYAIHVPVIWIFSNNMPSLGKYSNYIAPFIICTISILISITIFKLASLLSMHWLFKAPHFITNFFTETQLKRVKNYIQNIFPRNATYTK